MTKFIIVLLAVIAVVYAVLWHGKPTIDALTVVEIPTLLKRANEFDGRKVTVTGIVSHNVAFMGIGAYRLRQGDTEVLVLGAHGIPETGSQVRVQGTFKQAFAMNGFQYAVILEK